MSIFLSHITGHQVLSISLRFPKLNVLSPGWRGLILETPPSPLSYWIELHPIDKYDHGVPDLAPEPVSLSLDFHPLGSGDQISDQASETRLNHTRSRPRTNIFVLESSLLGRRYGFDSRRTSTAPILPARPPPHPGRHTAPLYYISRITIFISRSSPSGR